MSLIIQGWTDWLRDIELMYHIRRHSSSIPGIREDYRWVFPCLGIQFRHTADPLLCQVWWSQIWHLMHILFPGLFRQAGTHYSHMNPLQACLWTLYTHIALPLNDSFCWMFSISGCQHTECPLSDTKLLGACAAPADIWGYAWSVGEGRHVNDITIMLGVNLILGEWCPPYAYRRCTMLGAK